jgi:hypothetical protein
MSYTPNIYIPYIEGFHFEDYFLIYKNYYNSIGFNVKTFGELKDGKINYSKIINNLLQNENEEIFIIIDYIIIPKFAIDHGIEACKKYEYLVKPTNKVYIIEDYDQSNKITEALTSDDVLMNFDYSNKSFYDMWPLDGAWIFNKKNIKEIMEFSEPAGYDFNICYDYGKSDGVIFIQSDGYKIYPNFINIDQNTLFIYKSYLESIKNLFGVPENIFSYKNQILEKIEVCTVENTIFNVDQYFSKKRYI